MGKLLLLVVILSGTSEYCLQMDSRKLKGDDSIAGRNYPLREAVFPVRAHALVRRFSGLSSHLEVRRPDGVTFDQETNLIGSVGYVR